MTTINTPAAYVDPCPGMKGDDTVTEGCVKCSGTGEVDYGNVTFAVTDRNGRCIGSRRTCFDCGGSGKHTRTVRNIRAAARRDFKAREAQAAKVDQAVATRAAWVAAHPALAARLDAVYAEVFTGDRDQMAAYAAQEQGYKVYGSLLIDLVNTASYKGLSDAQTALAAKVLDERVAKAEAAAEIAASKRHLDASRGAKVVVTGTAYYAETVDGYAPGSKDMMILVDGDGEFEGVTFKIVGSGATLWDISRGDKVEIAGKVKSFTEYQGIPQTNLNYVKIKALATA